MSIHRKQLFNPDGDDSLTSRKMVGGNSTNLFNLNDVKYGWTKNMYRAMMNNFWIPEKVDLSGDSRSSLTEDEIRAYDGILSFLVVLDSLQTNNLPNIADYITAPEVSMLLAIQTYQEAIHSQSYAYVIETLVPSQARNNVYEFWRTDRVLLERNKYIAWLYQEFIDDPSEYTFKRALVANYLLEGLYFYNGFNFFYNLASRGKMLGTSEVIRYINRDEYTHCVIFKNILNDMLTAEDEQWVYELFMVAVDQEIKWTNHILGNRILGVSNESTEQYTKFLANRRLQALGLNPLYPEAVRNPYTHLERLADTSSEGTVKSNQFESTVTGYNQSTAVAGFEEF